MEGAPQENRAESRETAKKYRLQLPDGTHIEAESLEQVMELAREERENSR